MSEAMQALPHDDPMLLAWENWQTTPEFSNAKDWIVRGRNHIDGAIWRAFMEGWLAHRRATALPAGIPDPAAALRAAREALEKVAMITLPMQLQIEVRAALRTLTPAGETEARSAELVAERLESADAPPAPSPTEREAQIERAMTAVGDDVEREVLVERAQAELHRGNPRTIYEVMADFALAETAALRAENERLREALRAAREALVLADEWMRAPEGVDGKPVLAAIQAALSVLTPRETKP